MDIETQTLPYPDQHFDLVIANQIIEHTKQIFWIFSEISRVLKPNGHLMVGVPNLASLHNRFLLAFGRQPSCISLLGPHVRAFTPREFKKFIETDDYFDVIEMRGSNFYPFPPALAQPLSKIFPSLAVGLFILAKRTQKEGTFINVLKNRHYQTEYFAG